MKSNTNAVLHASVLLGILFIIGWNMIYLSQNKVSTDYSAFSQRTYLCYSPYIRGESPLTGSPLPNDILDRDLSILFSSFRYFQGFRVYSPYYSDEFFRDLAVNQVNLILSVDLSMNEKTNEDLFERTKSLCETYSNIQMLLIGNEFLFNKNNISILEDNLKKYQDLRTNLSTVEDSHSQFLISAADTFDSWMAFYPQLKSLVDCIALQIYAYGGQVDQCVANILTCLQNMTTTYPNASIFITEFGYPSIIYGQIQQEDQAQFYQLFFSQLGNLEQKLTKPLLGFCIFEYSDEWWKDPARDLYNNNGNPEENFGILTEGRQPKLAFNYLEGVDISNEGDINFEIFLIFGIFGINITYFIISKWKLRSKKQNPKI